MNRYAALFFLLALCFLGGCTKAPGMRDGGTRPTQTTHALPSSAYKAMAYREQGAARQNLLLMAASRAIDEGQPSEATEILAQLEDLTVEQKNIRALLEAKLALQKNQPQKTIQILSQIRGLVSLPVYYQAEFHRLLAIAFERRGQPVYALTERIFLDPLLDNEPARQSNRRQLWLLLTRMPMPELKSASIEEQGGRQFKGWVDLALVARGAFIAPNRDILQQLAEWQYQYPNHPANSLLPNPIDSVRPYLYPNPRNVALLLPTTGSLSGPGNAIKDGFLTAYHLDGEPRSLKIRIYDTASADSLALYEQAIHEGADFVIGPLAKNEVAKLVSVDHPVPTVFLNDLGLALHDNAYQFGLSPTNEARQVAVKAIEMGHRRAILITPAGGWGQEVSKAFVDQWQRAGGVVVEQMQYDDKTNLSHAVRGLLRVSESQAQAPQTHQRAQKVSRLPRRQDFDMVFLLAYPSKAREIMPLLKYYFIGNTPIFATSSVYSGNVNTMRDKDLDGVVFCDMPWVFKSQLSNRNWPEQFNSYNRLYAIGLDSYALLKELNYLILFPAMGLNDNTGVLYLNPNHQIARILAWGRFNNGVARQLYGQQD